MIQVSKLGSTSKSPPKAEGALPPIGTGMLTGVPTVSAVERRHYSRRRRLILESHRDNTSGLSSEEEGHSSSVAKAETKRLWRPRLAHIESKGAPEHDNLGAFFDAVDQMKKYDFRGAQHALAETIGSGRGPIIASGDKLPESLRELASRQSDHTVNLNVLASSMMQLSRELDKKFTVFNRINILNSELTKSVYLQDVVDRIYENFKTLIPYDRLGLGILYLKKDGSVMLKAKAARAPVDSTVALKKGYTEVLREDSSLREMLVSNKPRIINDLDHYLETHPTSKSTKLVVREGGLASLTCPLLVENKPIGFLFFTSYRKNAYNDAHVETFQSIATMVAGLVEKANLYEEALHQKKKTESLLLNILPASVANRLEESKEGTDTIIADSYKNVSLLQVGIKGFSSMTKRLNAKQLVEVVNNLHVALDQLCVEAKVEKIKTMGNSYLCAAGLPEPCANHAQRIAHLALQMLEEVDRHHREPDGAKVQIGIGIHSGAVVAGVVGMKKFSYDIWGDTVDVAASLTNSAPEGCAQVSTLTHELLKKEFAFEARVGSISLGEADGDELTFYLRGIKTASERMAVVDVNDSSEDSLASGD